MPYSQGFQPNPHSIKLRILQMTYGSEGSQISYFAIIFAKLEEITVSWVLI